MRARRSPNWTVVFAALAIAAAVPSAGRANPLPKFSAKADDFNLGLIGPKTPDILQKAKADPYAPPAEPLCERLPQELAALDAALGPDADAPKPKGHVIELRPTKWMGQAVRSAIPHRDIVRLVTGADRKQKALNEAEMAGWARRGYLKGLAKTLVCKAPQHAAVLNIPPAHVPGGLVHVSSPAPPAANGAAAASSAADAGVVVSTVAVEPAHVAQSVSFVATPTLETRNRDFLALLR